MNKKIIVSIVSTLLLAVVVALLNQRDASLGLKEVLVVNNLTDISITELYLGNDSLNTNLLSEELSPSGELIITIPHHISHTTSVAAIDSHGGRYLSTIEDKSTEIEIDIMDRSVFENTIEMAGEYWSGSGPYLIQIKNLLQLKDIYSISLFPYQSPEEDLKNLLEAFILYPGSSLNVRLDDGCYSLLATDNERNIYSIEQINVNPESETEGFEITEDLLVVVQESSGEGSCALHLVNDLDDWIVTEIYHRESGSTTWSENHIEFQALEPKQSFTLNLEPGSYDIKVVDEINDSYTNFNIVLASSDFTWQINLGNLDRFSP